MKRSHETDTPPSTNQTTPTGPGQRDVFSTLPQDTFNLISRHFSFSTLHALSSVSSKFSFSVSSFPNWKHYMQQQTEIQYLIKHKEAICKNASDPTLAAHFSTLNVLKDKPIADSYNEKEQCLDNINQTIIDKKIYSLPLYQPLQLNNAYLTRLPIKVFENDGQNKGNSTFRWSKLYALDISDNFLTFLPEHLGELTGLCILLLSNNQLSALPTTIGQLKYLGTLDIHGNQFTSVPTVVADLKALKYLDLTLNYINKWSTNVAKSVELIHKVNSFPIQINQNQCLALQRPFVKLTGPGALNSNNRLSILATALLESGKLKTNEKEKATALLESGKLKTNEKEKAAALLESGKLKTNEKEKVAPYFVFQNKQVDIVKDILQLNRLDQDYRVMRQDYHTIEIEIYGDLLKKVLECQRDVFSTVPPDIIYHIYHRLPPCGQSALSRSSKIFALRWENYAERTFLNEQALIKQKTEIQYLIANREKIEAQHKSSCDNFSKLKALKDKTSAAAFYAKEQCLDSINGAIIDSAITDMQTSNARWSDSNVPPCLNLEDRGLTRLPTKVFENDGQNQSHPTFRWSTVVELRLFRNFLTFLPEQLENIPLVYTARYTAQSLYESECLALQGPFVKLTGPDALNNNNRLSILADALLKRGNRQIYHGKTGVYLDFYTEESNLLAMKMLDLNRMEGKEVEGSVRDYRESTRQYTIEIYGEFKDMIEKKWAEKEALKEASGCKPK